jgi:hypothetical protein
MTSIFPSYPSGVLWKRQSHTSKAVYTLAWEPGCAFTVRLNVYWYSSLP